MGLDTSRASQGSSEIPLALRLSFGGLQFCEDPVGLGAPIRAAGKFLCALRSEQALVGQVSDPGLTFGCALRRPWRQTGFADSLRHLAHLLTTSAPMLDDALKKIGALFFPVDARESLCQGCEHRVFDAIGPRRREAFDDHRLQALDHDAAAHLHSRSDAELFACDFGVEAEHHQQWRKLLGAAAAKQQRYFEAVGRDRGHHSTLDVAPAGGIDQRRSTALCAWRSRIEIKEPCSLFTAGAQAFATRTAWLAVTAETMKSACIAKSAWEED